MLCYIANFYRFFTQIGTRSKCGEIFISCQQLGAICRAHYKTTAKAFYVTDIFEIYPRRPRSRRPLLPAAGDLPRPRPGQQRRQQQRQQQQRHRLVVVLLLLPHRRGHDGRRIRRVRKGGPRQRPVDPAHRGEGVEGMAGKFKFVFI